MDTWFPFSIEQSKGMAPMLTPKTPSSNLLVALSSLVFCFGISCAQDTATSPGSNVTQTPTSADPGNPASEQDPTANEQDPEGSETRATPTSETQSESLQVEISNTAGNSMYGDGSGL